MASQIVLSAKRYSDRAAARRAAILTAARALFLEHGFDEVGVRDIAREAKISPALVYRYGWTKADLLAELIFELNQSQIETIRRWRPRNGASLEARVLAFVRRLYELDIEQKDLRRLGAAYGWMWSHAQERKCIEQIVEILAPLRRMLTESGLDKPEVRVGAIWAAYWTHYRGAVIDGTDAAACAERVRPLIELALKK